MPRVTRLLSALLTATDEQLMWRVKLQGDSRAFANLMSRWEKPIHDLCTRMTGDLHRAEDLTQTAFTRVFARRADWQPAAKFSTFLWRVALNLCHDELRARNRRSECSLEVVEEEDARPADWIASEHPSPDESAEMRERAELVREALQELAPHYREVVVLRHYEHLKFHEIGTVLDIPEGTVKSRMAEALTQLTRKLQHLTENTSCNPKNHPKELLAL